MMQCSIDFDAAYPPHQAHSDTSCSSAAAVAPKFSSRMRLMLLQFQDMAGVGMTDDEGQDIMEMDGNSYRPCRVTLARHGYINDYGVRRKTRSGRAAAVWCITSLGINKLKEES